MKTRIEKIGKAALFFVLFLSFTNVWALEDENYFTISGVVKDKSGKKNLEYVNISVPGSNLSSITNEDGAFTLKIKDSIRAKEIEFSRIGYFSNRIAID